MVGLEKVLCVKILILYDGDIIIWFYKNKILDVYFLFMCDLGNEFV